MDVRRPDMEFRGFGPSGNEVFVISSARTSKASMLHVSDVEFPAVAFVACLFCDRSPKAAALLMEVGSVNPALQSRGNAFQIHERI
eukprot:s4391_g2.t1